jgi:hypothetical protein
MKLSELDNKERIVLSGSIFLVVIVFASSLYMYLNPPVQVIEIRVFNSYQKEGVTHVWTYGAGKIKLTGLYDMEAGSTYRVTYQSRSRNRAEIVLDVEKIG